jgi:hypothetical protein
MYTYLTGIFCWWLLATECDNFQIAVLMNWVECNKHKNCGESVVKCHLMYALYDSKVASR